MGHCLFFLKKKLCFHDDSPIYSQVISVANQIVVAVGVPIVAVDFNWPGGVAVAELSEANLKRSPDRVQVVHDGVGFVPFVCHDDH